MATSGTFTSDRYGSSSYGPWLSLKWRAIQQHVASNSTEVEFTLTFHWDRPISKTFRNHPGTLYGQSYIATGSATGNSGSKVLHTFKKWIYHDSNGTKSATVSGNVTGLGLTYSGVTINTMSVSGTMNLDRIARASVIKTAKIGNLINDNGTTLNVTSTYYSGDFYHKVSIWDGSVWMWDSLYYKGSPDGNYPVTKEGVNKMLNRMSSTTSKSFWIGLYTYTGNNGSGHIGTTSMYVTANVDSSIKPSSSGFSIGIDGSGYDKTLGKYIQGMTKVTGSYNSSAGYGATIASQTFTIRRKTSNTDSQTITGNSGTMSRPVALSGVYEAWGTITDSRGRFVYTNTIEFTVTAYSPPKITNFTAVRNSDAPTTVNLSRTTEHTVIDTDNNLSFIVQRRPIGGAWVNVDTKATGSITVSPSGNLSSTSTGNSVLESYDFRYVITDRFGHSAEAIISVPTQRVVLDIHKNEGIGIGKVHEKGVLDVGGQAYFSGDLYVNDVNIANADSIGQYFERAGVTPKDEISFWQALPQGVYFVRPDEIPGQPTQWGVIYHTRQSGDWNTIWYTQPRGAIYRKSGNSNNNFAWRLVDDYESGSNSNGYFYKHSNGQMFCIQRMIVGGASTAWGSMFYAYLNPLNWTFPNAFLESPSLSIGSDLNSHLIATEALDGITARGIHVLRPSAITYAGYVTVTATGRWR